MKTRPILLSVLAATALVFAGQDIQSAQPHMTAEMEVKALKQKVSDLESRLAQMEARLKQLEKQKQITVTPNAPTLFAPLLSVPPLTPAPAPAIPNRQQRQVNGQTFYVVPLSDQ